MYTYVYIYIYLYKHMYIYIYSDRHTNYIFLTIIPSYRRQNDCAPRLGLLILLLKSPDSAGKTKTSCRKWIFNDLLYICRSISLYIDTYVHLCMYVCM